MAKSHFVGNVVCRHHGVFANPVPRLSARWCSLSTESRPARVSSDGPGVDVLFVSFSFT